MNKFSFKQRVTSFKFAAQGLRYFVKNEHNSWIHISITIVAVILGIILNISTIEWVEITLSVGIVIMAEILNTSIEELADKVEPEKDVMIKNTKDLAAGAVLIASIMAIIIGSIIFIPKIIEVVF